MKWFVEGAQGTTISEGSELEEDKHQVQRQVSHDTALRHIDIDELVQYLKEQDNSSLCEQMLLKKLNNR